MRPTALKHSVGFVFTDNPAHAEDVSYAITPDAIDDVLGEMTRGRFPTQDETTFGDVTNVHTVYVDGPLDHVAVHIRTLVEAHLAEFRECSLDATQVSARDLKNWIQAGCQLAWEEDEEEDDDGSDGDGEAEAEAEAETETEEFLGESTVDSQFGDSNVTFD